MLELRGGAGRGSQEATGGRQRGVFLLRELCREGVFGLMRLKCLKLLFVLVFVGLAFLLGGCTNPDGYERLSLSNTQPVGYRQQDTDRALRVAFASITSPKESLVYYGELLRYLEEHLDRPIKVIQRKTYKEVNDLLAAGEVDLAFICTYSYVLGVEDFGLQPFLVPEIRGKTTYQSYIIVPTDSAVRDFADLEGKRFAFTDPWSTSGYLYPRYLVELRGETTESFFQRTIYTYSHDNSIKAVAEKVVDGAAIDGLVLDYIAEKNPEFAAQVRVIHKSREFGSPPVVVSPKLDERTKSRLKTTFLEMHLNAEGREILEHLRTDRFVEQEDSDYDTVRQLAEAVFR